MKARLVIRIGRRRRRAASIAGVIGALAAALGLLGELDDQDRVLGGQAHRRQQPDLEIHVVLQPARPDRQSGSKQPSGMTSMTEIGIDQLS
jgi:hypothetical protein